MHFRIRGNHVQLIKPVYDDEAGRTKSTLVGAANLSTGQLNEKATANLSDEEKAEVTAWLEQRRALDYKKAELTALMLADTLNTAAAHLPEMEPELAKTIVADVLAASQNFRRMARKQQLLPAKPEE
ncbi:hypothetical protein [Rhabdochromatium marinum]|uniref:hypothetical protein n=1 Tax=Rhabdochromatium marinum TaxID=48729 RepID=UPI001907243D|nr:hypothetical protein [Rhabdochromatium marinum]MBK1648043.1 hypothetical protein [Rhabdochromatium marinum]